jgi:gliding motility-associated-like protein
MKKYILILFFVTSFIPVIAKHITGGEVIYDYKSPGAANSKIYTITLRLFRDNTCTGCSVMPTSVGLRIFNNDNNSQLSGDLNIPLNSQQPVAIILSPPCLSNQPTLDYNVGLYIIDIEVPNNNNGYTITYQTCCRVDNIENIGNGTTIQVGSTYTGGIPGNNSLSNNLNDNGARFETGISIICAGKPFKLDFSAIDPDNDVLEYSFVNAYDGGPANNSTCNGCPAAFASPIAPPYPFISYQTAYSGLNPFGTNAVINSSTGIISGIAPSAGKYIIAVNVKSFRNGNFITSHRKDFIVTVAPCDFASSELKVSYTNCDNLDFLFKNENSSLLNLTFDWNFGDPASGLNNTSTQEFPPHTYSAPGNYTLTLIVNRNTPCADTATALVRVWPGFNPAFAPIPPQCKNTPVQFTDLTTTSYPPVTYWHWDFGVTTLTNDTSRLKNPTYTYTDSGTYKGTFIVETVKGCRDTLYPEIKIVDKPIFFVSNDTLICTIDTLQLKTNVNTGTIIWSPNTAIDNVNSFTPLVSPDVTQVYTANYTDQFGCKNSDAVTVNVVNEVTLLDLKDTVICRTDQATLNLNTDALYFNWTSTPASTITTPTTKNPVILPTAASTTYFVKASISNKCFKEKNIEVKTVPYPIPNVSSNAPICFGKDAQLNASGGSDFTWSPAIYLSNIKSQNPQVIKPLKTTTYTVTVKDTLGCPKPVSKPITVEVIKIIADAGPSDTSIVLDQPLFLNATSNTTTPVDYFWTSPNTWLSDINIKNPIANPLNNITYKVIVTNSIGCEGSDTINVKVFFLPPDIYVPSAFTPSPDGKNDLFRPIALGIKSLELFSVYSRWGQLLYSTNKINAGWDGKYKGVAQNPGTYVWQANATDYKNKKIARKGTVILIR